LTGLLLFIKNKYSISGVHARTVRGNFVKIEDGPAAVTGDESHKKVTIAFLAEAEWDGKACEVNDPEVRRPA
jgi:hypothetical protein